MRFALSQAAGPTPSCREGEGVGPLFALVKGFDSPKSGHRQSNCRITLRAFGALGGGEAQREVRHPVQEAFRKLHPSGIGKLDVVNALEQDA